MQNGKNRIFRRSVTYIIIGNGICTRLILLYMRDTADAACVYTYTLPVQVRHFLIFVKKKDKKKKR